MCKLWRKSCKPTKAPAALVFLNNTTVVDISEILCISILRNCIVLREFLHNFCFLGYPARCNIRYSCIPTVFSFFTTIPCQTSALRHPPFRISVLASSISLILPFPVSDTRIITLQRNFHEIISTENSNKFCSCHRCLARSAVSARTMQVRASMWLTSRSTQVFFIMPPLWIAWDCKSFEVGNL